MRRTLLLLVTLIFFTAARPSPAGAEPTMTDDQVIAQAGLLTIGDFPAGWTQSPSPSPSPTDPHLSKYGKTCAHLETEIKRQKSLGTAHAQSPSFRQGSSARIFDSSGVYPTSAAVVKVHKLQTQPALVGCLQRAGLEYNKKELPKGTRVSVSERRVSVPKVGDQSIGYRVAVTGTKSGRTLVRYVGDFQLIRVGRVALTFVFEGQDTTPMLDSQQMVQAVVARVDRAQRLL